MNKPEQPGPADPAEPIQAGKPAADAALPAEGSKPSTAGATAAEKGEPAGAKRGGGKAVASVLVAVLLLGGGFWLGKATTDPSNSDEYIALEATAQKAAADRDVFRGQLEEAQGEVAAIRSAAVKQDDAMLLREAAVKKAEDELKIQADGVKKREAAVSGAEKKQAANTVGDGTWVVGVDIEPGTYKAKSAVGSSCYWGIYTSGSNGDDIIANDIPGGGLPTVNLAAGQDFKSARCGTWAKQ